jgi:hypothetical protein
MRRVASGTNCSSQGLYKPAMLGPSQQLVLVVVGEDQCEFGCVYEGVHGVLR